MGGGILEEKGSLKMLTDEPSRGQDGGSCLAQGKSSAGEGEAPVQLQAGSYMMGSLASGATGIIASQGDNGSG